MKYIKFGSSEVKINEKDTKVIQKIINSGQHCNGEYTRELEKHFREKFNVKYAFACASCTSGLIIAVKALGLENFPILMPAFTWLSTLYAIQCNNNIPIWCDVNFDSWDINPELAENGYYWEAQISVDIFGNESYIKKKNEYGHDIPTIYDAAHGYGLDNLGHRGDIEVVSLGINKPVTCMQGGMILFNNDLLAEYIDKLIRLSAKITEVSAYVGLKSIEEVEDRISEKNEIRDMYRYYLDVPFTEQKVHGNSICSTFSILFNNKKKREAVTKAFRDNGIEVKTYYEPLYKGLKNTDTIYNRIIALPTYKEMIPEVKRICKLINEA